MDQEVGINLRINNPQSLKDLQTNLKGLELAAKTGAISTAGYTKELKLLGDVGKGLNLSLKDQISFFSQLTNAQQRAAVGAKDLRVQLREMYTEQRLQGRVLNEMRQGVMGLSAAFGSSGLGRSISSVIMNFDALESSVRASAIAATNAGGKFATLGGILTAVAGPASILAAIGLTIGQNWMAGVQQYEQAMERYRKATGEGKKPAPSMRDPFGFGVKIGQPSGALMQIAPWLVGLGLPGYRAEIVNQVAEEEEGGFETTRDPLGRQSNRPAGGWFPKGQTIYGGFPESVAGRDFGRGGVQGRWGLSQDQYASAIKPRAGGVQGPDLAPLKEGALEISAIWASGIQSLNVGVMSVANTIRTQVSAAWEQVFGRANSLFEIFMQNMISTMAGNLASIGANWLLSQIPIFGPIIAGLSKPDNGMGYGLVRQTDRVRSSAYKQGFYGR